VVLASISSSLGTPALYRDPEPVSAQPYRMAAILFLEPSPFKWGGGAVTRDGGVMSRSGVGLPTPPPSYDEGTSPFEWGGL